MNNRPTSPHIGIYKKQINTFISIMHRFTGIGIFFVSIALPWIFLFYIFGCKECITNIISCNITKIFLFFLSFGFIYHSLSGVRHLFYDVGLGFSIKTTNFTGWLVLILSIFITIIFWNFIV
jgi:succinate dehydrogenase / fumarate reductase cytochrome b subunit